MPNSCAVLGCKNRQSKTLRLYRFPAICKKPKFKELSLIRRNRWLTAIQRDDINEKNARVCAIHFISGASAPLKDRYNPDWVPSLNMGNPLYPKRQKYSSSAERKEHAFAELFALIGDGETNTEKSTTDDNPQSDEDQDHSQDHNYSRNLISDNNEENSEEPKHNVNESIDCFQNIDYCDTISERFSEPNIKNEPEENFIEPVNIEVDVDVVTCDTIEKFNQQHNNNEHIPHQNLNQPLNEYSEIDSCNRINRIKFENSNEIDSNSKVITIFHSEPEVDNCHTFEKFNATLKDNYYEARENLNEKTIYYVENCDSIDRLNELDDNNTEPNINETAIFYSKFIKNENDVTTDEVTFNGIVEKTKQIQEHNYSNKINLYSTMENIIDYENQNMEYNNIEIINNPETIFNEIGTQTYMSNNMFEYLVKEIAKKNLVIQQKSSIIAEKDKKIGKLKLKLHKLRLEIYNSKKRNITK